MTQSCPTDSLLTWTALSLTQRSPGRCPVHCSAGQYYIMLHVVSKYGMVWYGMVWYGMPWYGITYFLSWTEFSLLGVVWDSVHVIGINIVYGTEDNLFMPENLVTLYFKILMTAVVIRG